MLFSPHLIASGVLGEKIGNPETAFMAGFFLHFVLDAIPHFETIKRNKKTQETKFGLGQIALMAVDLFIAIFIIKYYLKIDSQNSGFIWGAIGGMAPDLLDNIPFWNKIFRKTKFGRYLHKIHESVHIILDPPAFVGILTQILVIIVAVYYH